MLNSIYSWFDLTLTTFPTSRAQNNLRDYAIRLGDVYVCDDAHDEILGTMFSRYQLVYDEFIMEGEVDSSDDSYDVAIM